MSAPTQRREPVVATAMPRRSFLRRAGVGALTGLVAADAALAYRAYDRGVLAEGRGPAFDARDAWHDADGPEGLVGAAVLAASAHNAQPWLFHVTAGGVDVLADRSRSTGANDALDRELHVSLGCALENLVLAAAARGAEPDVELAPRTGPDVVASVGLRTGPGRDSGLHRAIGDRRSNRSEYAAEPVPTAALAAMDGFVDASVAGARLAWVTGRVGRRALGELVVDAARAHAADEEQSVASFAWWRGTADEVRRHRDGLSLDGVGLPAPVRTLAKLLPPTSRAAADETFVARTALQARSAAAFGVVLVEDPLALADQLTGGRLLQRLHLWTTAHGIGFQHMDQVTERIDRDASLGRRSDLAAPLADLVGPGTLGAFRIGTPTVAALPSPRRPVAEVLR